MDTDSTTKKNHRVEIQNYSTIFEKLSEKDLKKILFLVISSEDLESYDQLIENKTCIERKLHDLQLCDGSDLLLETLDTIKKYVLFPMFGFNKCDTDVPSGFIPEFRKFLFSICEELTKDDVLHLCETYELDSRSMSAESFMCHMLLENKIYEEDITALKTEFSKMKRGDLLKIITNYYNEQATRHPEKNNISIDKPMEYTVEATTKKGKCGLAVIFNQKKFKNLDDRIGTDIDRDKLIELWENFGFEVLSPYENEKAHEITSIFEELATITDPYSVFVACLLSHGKEGGEIYGSDGNKKRDSYEGTVSVQDLVDIMANKCKPLFGKPKLFFIVSCRGTKNNRGIAVVSDGGSADDKQSVDINVEYIPCRSDTYVVYSTIEGYESCRIETEGTFFVKSLVECLTKYGTKEDIDLVMKRVIYNVSKKSYPGNRWQIPQYQSTLRGILKFKTLAQLHNSSEAFYK